MSTVSPLEILVVGIGLFGAGVCTRTLFEAYHDLDLLKAAGRNGTLRAIAVQVYRNEIIRLVTLMSCVGIGTVSMFLSNSPGPFSAPRLILASFFFIIEGTLVYGGWADRNTNRSLEK